MSTAPPQTREGRLSQMSHVVARGIAINVVFVAGIQLLVTTQGLIVPRLLGPTTVGLFAVALAVTGTASNLKELGIAEKLVQERHADLPLAYSVAFTLELIISTAVFVAIVGFAPLLTLFYDRPQLLPIVAILGLTLYTAAFLDLPSALYQRDLRYFRQNLVTAIQPVAGFLATVPLAFAGAGIWSLVAGPVAAFVAATAAVAWLAPIRPRLRLHRPLVRSFLSYGWPLWLSAMVGISTTIAGTIVISKSLGLAALGFFTVAQGMGQRALSIDGLLGRTLFPALCRAQDDLAAMRRAFVTTNRVTAMWSGFFGFGMAVFAGDLVRLVLGRQWSPAIFLFEMEGLSVVTLSIGWSWDMFFRARGETRPSLIVGIVAELWVFLVLLPASVIWGLTGAGWAVLSLGAISIVARQIPLRRLFPGINIVAHAWRELLATMATAAAVVGIREVVGHPTSLLAFAAIVVLYVLLVAGAVLAVDRRFLVDLVRRVRRPPAGLTAPDTADDELMLRPVAAVTEGTAPAGERFIIGLGSSTGLRIEDSIPMPGAYPLWVTPGGEDRVWVTLRDSSSIALLDVGSARWRKWRFPAYPHVACVDDRGRAWFALTLSSSVGVVDPVADTTRRIRLARSKELLVAAWDGDQCLVIDADRRVVWHIDGDSAGGGRERRFAALPLPDGMVRPDFVAVAPNGDLWVTDTAAPVLGHMPTGKPPRLVPVPVPSRTAIVDADRQCLWVGHWSDPLISRLDLSDPERPPATFEIPGVPFGLSVGPDGRTWAAMPAIDALVAVDEAGATERHALPPGSGPGAVSLAWAGSRLYVACSGNNQLVVWS